MNRQTIINQLNTDFQNHKYFDLELINKYLDYFQIDYKKTPKEFRVMLLKSYLNNQSN